MEVTIKIPESFIEIGKEHEISDELLKEIFTEYIESLIDDYYEPDDESFLEFLEEYL